MNDPAKVTRVRPRPVMMLVGVLIAAGLAAVAAPGPAAAAMVAPGQAATVGAAVAAPADAPTTRYAALGDSFSAGVGTTAPNDAGAIGATDCRRSALAYPVLWAARHAGTRLSFLACSGARISTVRSQQISQVPRDTSLVTVTMGGNDVGFAAAVEICALAARDRSCTLAVALARLAAVTVVPVQLVLTLAAIKNQAPHARIVVLGYPRLFELGPCPGRVPAESRRSSINGGADLLDGVLEHTAALFGARFVDVRGRFAGHGLCAPGGQAWITGPGTTDSYHPTAAGQAQGYLPALQAVTG
jgi:lysophospholipase L1-like esterase